MSEAIAAKGARVTGIDPAHEAIRAARTHADGSDLAVRYDVGVGEALPYLEASYDAVVCVDVLEHIQDLEQVISEIARVLKPAGMFLFDTINRNWLARLATITIAEDILGLLPRGTHDWRRFVTPAELEAMLADSGLTVRERTGVSFNPLADRWRLSRNASVNYMLLAAKGT